MNRYWLVSLLPFLLGCDPGASSPPAQSPTATALSQVPPSEADIKNSNVIKIVVDDLDSKLSINAFGDVTCRGTTCEIALEPGYYSQLEDVAKPKALEKIAGVWKKHGGKSVIFRDRDGKVVSEF